MLPVSKDLSLPKKSTCYNFVETIFKIKLEKLVTKYTNILFSTLHISQLRIMPL